MAAPIPEDEGDDLKAKIEAALFSNRLNDWERNFLNDMRVKLEVHGSRTRFSVKQYQIIRRIVSKVDKGGPAYRSKVSHLSNDRRPAQRQAYRWKRRWRWGRFTRLATVFVFSIVLMVGTGLYELFNGQLNTGLSGGQIATLPSGSGIASNTAYGGITVVDGDTVRARGHTERVRLVGFNAPETFSPQCAREKSLGDRATARLLQLVSGGKPELTFVRCSCPPGTEGTQQCNFGRSCGILRVNGVDVGETLISEGLAVRFTCGATSCPRMPRPWCQ